MTDNELKELVASLAVAQAKTEALMAKNEIQYAKTDAKLDRLAKLYGGVADNLGSSAEEYFYNSLAETKQIGDLHFDNIYERVKGGDPSNQLEYDIVLVNGNCAALIEVKYKVHANALTQLERQLNHFKTHFPMYERMKLYGGVAGFSVPDDVVQSAHEKGYFVLKRSGDTFAVDTQGMKAF
jgi:hypothetical protein